MCETDGATKLWGEGRITNENKPENFQVMLLKARICGHMYMQT